VLSFTREDFEMEPVVELGSIKEILEHSDLFQGLSDDQLAKVLPLCQEEVYEAGVVTSPEGTVCRIMYVIQSGKVAVEVTVRIGRGAEGSATIDVITQGNCFGFPGLIDPNILSTRARTLERTKVIALNAAELKRLLEDNPEMGCKVMSNLAKVVCSRLQSVRQTASRILSVIFHDLKAPLAAAENYNRLLLGEFVGELNEEQRDMIQRSSDRLSGLLNLVTNLIDLSRIDFGDLRMERISLAEVIEGCVEVMLPLAEKKGLQLIAEVPRGLPAVLGSPARLEQVVRNLLSNAIKYTHSGGVVAVKVKDETYDIQAEVTDTGIGIPTEELPKIFDGFYRGLDIVERGTGLGLSISKKIVEAHHGRIWAVSPCPESGKGSKFVFTLPKIGEE